VKPIERLKGKERKSQEESVQRAIKSIKDMKENPRTESCGRYSFRQCKEADDLVITLIENWIRYWTEEEK